MEDCLFCKIIKGNIPCEKVYEDDDVFAFMDIKPINMGHVLVVPKEHFVNLFDLDQRYFEPILLACQRIGEAVADALDADGFNLMQSNGEAAGQAVMHAHFHIIPRFADDGLRHWPRKDYANGEIKQFAAKIREKL